MLLASPKLLEILISRSALRKRKAARFAALELEGDDLAETGHLPPSQPGLRMIGTAAEKHAHDTWLAGEVIGDLGGRCALRSHAHAAGSPDPSTCTQALKGLSEGPVCFRKLCR